jgi:hypothetical protein
MSDTSAFGFGQFVPGFDFLQNLSKTAAQAAPAAGAVPGMASWVAPTLSIEEIDKRIQELKAVQFWLDQNATALKATIQAMEVQKMTLSTLQSMNVNMADLAKAFTAKPPTPTPTSAPEAAAEETAKPKTSIFSPKPAPATEPEVEEEEEEQDAPVEALPDAAAQAEAGQNAKPAGDKPAVDPMQWWGALTQQFQGIAAAAMKDVAGEAMKAAATAAAQTSAQKGAKAPAKPAGKPAVKTAAKTAVKPAAKAPSKSKTQPKSGGAVKAASKSVAKSAGASYKTASPKKR